MKFGAVVCMQLSALQTPRPALEYARQSHFLKPTRTSRVIHNAHNVRDILQALQQTEMSNHHNSGTFNTVYRIDYL